MSLARYLDAVETPNNTTLASAWRWDNHESPYSEPLRDLQLFLGRYSVCVLPGALLCSAPVRRVLLHPAALRAILTHPTTLFEMREASDPRLWLERFLRLAPGTIEASPEMGTSVLLLGEADSERYAIFNVIEEAAPA